MLKNFSNRHFILKWLKSWYRGFHLEYYVNIVNIPQSDDREEAQIARSSLTIDLAFDLAPLDLTSARSRLRPTDLWPTDLSLWFWFLLLLWWCGSGVLVVVAFDSRSLLPWVELEFQWCVVLGFGCDFEIFCNKICLDAEKIVDKMWKFCKKIAFSE